MKVIKLGMVGVDSGQLMICDPCYIDSHWTKEDDSKPNIGHTIYQHKEDNSYWQYCYGVRPQEGVNSFPGDYREVIPKYGKSPNELINDEEFIATDKDPTPHIPLGKFSYEGVCKVTIAQYGGQLNYESGGPGVGVAFQTGIGDGYYPVYAQLEEVPGWGERVVRVWIDFLDLNEEEE